MLELLDSSRAAYAARTARPSPQPAPSAESVTLSTATSPLVAVFTTADPEPLQSAIRSEGMRTQFFHPVTGDLAQALAQRPAIVVAEIHHGGFGGFDLIRALRARGFAGPLFALLDGSDTFNAVVALEVGADLMLELPLEPRLLRAYLRKSLQTNSTEAAATAPFTVGSLEFDVTSRVARLRGRDLRLGMADFELLALLCRRPGRVVTRAEIAETLGMAGRMQDRTVDSRVSRLRTKLAEHGVSGLMAMRGRGYLFSPRRAQGTEQ
jgi:DNA-binding response OmpR family regulator